MLEQLLKTIGFPEALNFDLENKIVKSKPLVKNIAPDDDINYESGLSENLDYIKDWGYRSEKYGKWVCLDINIKESRFDDIFCKVNELLKSYNHDIIDVVSFNSHDYYKNPSYFNYDESTRIDFLKVDSFLSIQIVKFKTII